MRVMVLMGGASPERAVSLDSGTAVARALEERGVTSWTFDPWTDGATGRTVVERLLAALQRERPDVVFVALHGGDGENGGVQAVLELAGAVYTGSGVAASAVAMDKHMCKKVIAGEGVPTPRWRMWTDGGDATALAEEIGYPLVVKPNGGGSTIGLSIVEAREELDGALDLARAHDARVMLEKYVAGKEMTVAVLEGAASPVVEILPESGFYDYEAKYTPGKTRYVVPAEVSAGFAEEIRSRAACAYETLGCAGVARVDFRVTGDEKPFFLEINTVPGLTATSLVPKALAAEGVSFGELVERLCRLAASKGASG